MANQASGGSIKMFSSVHRPPAGAQGYHCSLTVASLPTLWLHDWEVVGVDADCQAAGAYYRLLCKLLHRATQLLSLHSA